MSQVIYIAQGRAIGKAAAQRSFVDAVLRRAHFLSLAAPSPSKRVNASSALPAAVVTLMPKPPASSLAAGTNPTGETTAATPFNGGHDGA